MDQISLRRAAALSAPYLLRGRHACSASMPAPLSFVFHVFFDCCFLTCRRRDIVKDPGLLRELGERLAGGVRLASLPSCFLIYTLAALLCPPSDALNLAKSPLLCPLRNAIYLKSTPAGAACGSGGGAGVPLRLLKGGF